MTRQSSYSPSTAITWASERARRRTVVRLRRNRRRAMSSSSLMPLTVTTGSSSKPTTVVSWASPPSRLTRSTTRSWPWPLRKSPLARRPCICFTTVAPTSASKVRELRSGKRRLRDEHHGRRRGPVGASRQCRGSNKWRCPGRPIGAAGERGDAVLSDGLGVCEWRGLPHRHMQDRRHLRGSCRSRRFTDERREGLLRPERGSGLGTTCKSPTHRDGWCTGGQPTCRASAASPTHAIHVSREGRP